MVSKNDLYSLIEYFCNSLNYLVPSPLIPYISIRVLQNEKKRKKHKNPELSAKGNIRVFNQETHISKDYGKLTEYGGNKVPRKSTQICLFFKYNWGNDSKNVQILSDKGSMFSKLKWHILDFLSLLFHTIFNIFKPL